MKALRIPRRALLRGMAGTAVSLPLLECMLPRAARAQQAPRRYCLTFGGFSLNVDGSPGAQALVPDRAGAGYDVKRMLDPIDDYPSSSGASLRDEITVVSGLSIPHAQRLGEPGARAPGDSFHFHTNPMLCGLPQQGELDATVTGPSSDQLVADAIGGDSLFSSLTYRAQARFYNTGGGTFDAPHHRDTMSFRMVSGSARAVTPETSPRAAYDSLFTLFTPTDPAQAAERARELAKRRSILDFVDRNINGLLPRLSSYDRQRMEQHYDEIRALENLLGAEVTVDNPGCQLPPDPGPDPAMGGDFSAPFAWNSNDGYSGEDARADLFNNLLRMALICDLTRVATLMYTMFQSFMNAHPLVGASFNVHALNHNGQQGEHTEMVRWHIRKHAELVAMLRDTPELGGSLLDSCALAMLIEGGFRSGTSTVPGGHSHTTENMVCLLSGGAGGLRRGEHIAVAGRHPGNVLLSLMRAVNAPASSLGDVSGELNELFV